MQRILVCVPLDSDSCDLCRAPVRIRSAAFSPIMMVAALVLTETILGMTEASATSEPGQTVHA